MKKRGFGIGKWNGYGGKLLEGETIVEAALREMKEEISIGTQPEHLIAVGKLNFYFQHKPDWNQEVNIFLISKWQGEPMETEEMRPQWFRFHEIPYDNMWPDDKYWLPKVLQGYKVEGDFFFNLDGTDFDSFNLKEI